MTKEKKQSDHKVDSDSKKDNHLSSKNISRFFSFSRIVGIGIVAFGIVAVTFVGLIVIQKFLSASDVAGYLPVKKTALLIQADFKSLQAIQLQRMLNQNPLFNRDRLMREAKKSFDLDLNQDLKPWFGSKIAYALIKNPQDPARFSGVLFVETRNRNATLNVFKKLYSKREKNLSAATPPTVSYYQEAPVYALNNVALTFIERYAVVSTDERMLKELIQIEGQPVDTVVSSTEYLTVMNNLPRKSLGFIYVNTEVAVEMFDHPRVQESFGYSPVFARPLLGIFPALGAAITTVSDGIYVHGYSMLKKSALKDENLFKYDKAYHARLLQYIDPNDTIVQSGGIDLQKQLKRLFEISKELHPTAALVAEGFLRAKKTDYFGSDISLEDDIYPLFEHEHLFSVHGYVSKPDFLLLAEVDKADASRARLKKLQTKFLELQSLLEPQLQEVILPDGTKAEEIVAPRNLTPPQREEYRGEMIEGVHLTKPKRSVYFTVARNLAIFGSDQLTVTMFSTNKDLIKKTIDHLKSGDDLFSGSQLERSYGRLKLSNDTKSMVNLTKLSVAKDLAPFHTFISGSTIFDDGVAVRAFVDASR